MKGIVAICLAALALLVTHAAPAAPKSYAIVIGNNAPPAGDGLVALRYADDDAIRYAEFFSRLGRVWLLTRLDAGSGRRHAAWKAQAAPPSLERVRQAVAAIAQQLEKDRAAGDDPTVFITFSGHGALSQQGEYYLSLEGGELTRSVLYDEVLEPLRSAKVSLIVDACHAAGVVGARGAFDHELDAQTEAVDAGEKQALLARYSLQRFPNVGVLLASSQGQETHEWSRIEAGVFTYEVTSALLGAADLNGDLRIEYGEVAAFVAAANRAISNPDAVPTLVARAPRGKNAVLVDLTTLHNSLLLTGRARDLGRFYVELRDGERWLSVHVPEGTRLAVALPLQSGSFVRAGDREAEIPVTRSGIVELDRLHFLPSSVASRGSVERSLQQSLFAEPFDRAFYQRFAAHSDLPGISFDLTSRRASFGGHALPEDRAPSRAPAIVLGTVSATAVATAIVSGYLGLHAYSEFQSESRQRQASALHSDVIRYRSIALASAAVGLGTGVGAWFAWPSRPATTAEASGPMLGVSGTW